jgi:hypothetical protein
VDAPAELLRFLEHRLRFGQDLGEVHVTFAF